MLARRTHYTLDRKQSLCGHMDKQGQALVTTNVHKVSCKVCLRAIAKAENK